MARDAKRTVENEANGKMQAALQTLLSNPTARQCQRKLNTEQAKWGAVLQSVTEKAERDLRKEITKSDRARDSKIERKSGTGKVSWLFSSPRFLCFSLQFSFLSRNGRLNWKEPQRQPGPHLINPILETNLQTFVAMNENTKTIAFCGAAIAAVAIAFLSRPEDLKEFAQSSKKGLPLFEFDPVLASGIQIDEMVTDEEDNVTVRKSISVTADEQGWFIRRPSKPASLKTGVVSYPADAKGKAGRMATSLSGLIIHDLEERQAG